MESKRTINVMFNGVLSTIKYFGNFDLNIFKETVKEQLKINEPSKNIKILDEDDCPLMICEPVPNLITIKISIDAPARNFQPSQFSSAKQNPFFSPTLSRCNQVLPNPFMNPIANQNQPLPNPIFNPMANQKQNENFSNLTNDNQGVSVNLSFSKPFQQPVFENQKIIWEPSKNLGQNANQKNTLFSKPFSVNSSSEKDFLENPIVPNLIPNRPFLPKEKFKEKIRKMKCAKPILKNAKIPPHKKSPYIFFIREKYKEVSRANPDKKGRELMKLLGEMWKNLDRNQKEIYEKMADEDYQRALKYFNESNNENFLGQKRERNFYDKVDQD